MSTPVENIDFELRVAVDRFNRAIIGWNFEDAWWIFQTRENLLAKRYELAPVDPPDTADLWATVCASLGISDARQTAT